MNHLWEIPGFRKGSSYKARRTKRDVIDFLVNGKASAAAGAGERNDPEISEPVFQGPPLRGDHDAFAGQVGYSHNIYNIYSDSKSTISKRISLLSHRLKSPTGVRPITIRFLHKLRRKRKSFLERISQWRDTLTSVQTRTSQR